MSTASFRTKCPYWLCSACCRPGYETAAGRSWDSSGLLRGAESCCSRIAAATVRIVLGELVVEPIATAIWRPVAQAQVLERVRGDGQAALWTLLFVWTFAALGEEISYRGYLLLRAADFGNRSPASYWIGMIFVSVLFGFGHYYKGPAGIVDSTFAGLVLGSAYLISGRNLWVSILAHGLIDTVAVVALYFNW